MNNLEIHSTQFIGKLIYENPDLAKALKKARDERNQAGLFTFALLISHGVSVDEAIKSLEVRWVREQIERMAKKSESKE